MTTLIKSIHKYEYKFEKKAERFTFHHPYFAFFALFIGMPIFTLIAVAAGTTVIALPLSLIFGWV